MPYMSVPFDGVKLCLPACLSKIAVSDRRTLKGLTQFPTTGPFPRSQLADSLRDGGRGRFEGGFCATLFQTVRNFLILKRRDVRVVEGARLESVCRGNSTEGSNPSLSAN